MECVRFEAPDILWGSMPEMAGNRTTHVMAKGALASSCKPQHMHKMPSRFPRISNCKSETRHATCNPMCHEKHIPDASGHRARGEHTSPIGPPGGVCGGGTHAYVSSTLQGCSSSSPGAPGGPRRAAQMEMEMWGLGLLPVRHKWSHAWPSRESICSGRVMAIRAENLIDFSMHCCLSACRADPPRCAGAAWMK